MSRDPLTAVTGSPYSYVGRIQQQCFRASVGENVADAVLTAATFELVRLQGKFIPGKEISLLNRASDWPLWQRGLIALFRGEVGGASGIANLLGKREARRLNAMEAAFVLQGGGVRC